ncbi:MAG: hypothetical protein JWP83_2460 [Mycobacterium sp.]|nr:hypothetical protein [Mycobacterium sp.]
MPFELPTGTTVDVYAPGDPTALYSYTNNVDYFPIPSSGVMNTGLCSS